MTFLRSIFRFLAQRLAKWNIYLTRSLSFRKDSLALPPNFDYVRYASLALCFEEIVRGNIDGSIAEVGVYKGDFAKRLNLLFHERKLFLFDTFSGFDSSELSHDLDAGLTKKKQYFNDTSVKEVLSQMPFPEQCIVKAGSFPKSAEGLNESFCFVSIDVDLYEPCKAALVYFIPRVQKGGFIMIHDYHNAEYNGIKKSVQELSSKLGFSFVPIPDHGGSVIIPM